MSRLIVFLLIDFVLIINDRNLSYAQSFYSVGDLIFCLDASGSMLFVLEPNPSLPWNDPANLPPWSGPPTPPVAGTRWHFARLAFEQLMNDIDFIVEGDMGPDGNGRYPRLGWVGIAQFPANVPGPTAYSEIFKPMEMIPDNVLMKENFFNIIRDAIGVFRPRVGIPGTPMANGLELARAQFQLFGGGGAPIPNHVPNKRAIFLFTDGENNQPPLITATYADAFNKVSGVEQNLSVYPVGFGNPADLASSVSELSNLAVETGAGIVYFLDPGSITGSAGARRTPELLGKLIRDQVVESLGFSNVLDPLFSLKADESKSFDIGVCEYDTTLFLTIRRDSFQDIRNPTVNVHISDSLIINAGNVGNFGSVRYAEKGNSQYFAFGFQFIQQHLGVWQVVITAVDDGLFDFSSFARDGLGFDITTKVAGVKTGDSIAFEMHFSPGAVSADSIIVELNREEPPIGLGNLFTENLLTDRQMDTVFSVTGNPNITPASYKYRYLASQDRIPRLDFEDLQVVFNDRGREGDKMAGDGIFTWTTDPVLIPDIYKFIFNVRDKTSNANEFFRSKTLHVPVFVKVVPDWNVSTIEFKPLGQSDEGGNNIGEIRIRLSDVRGKIVGPGYDRDLKINISEGRLVGTVQNDLEGNYTQLISYPPGSQPVLSVSFQDLNFPEFEVPGPRWAISMHYGLSFPQKGFKNLYKDKAQTVIIDLDYYFIQSPWALSLMIGYTRFKGKNAAIPDNDLISANLMARYQFNHRHAFRPFIEAGPAYYNFENTDDEFGAAAGIGIDYRVTSRICMEIAAAYNTDHDVQFIQTRAGLKYRF